MDLALSTSSVADPRPPDIPFAVQALDIGASETAAAADINRDGWLDILSGEKWHEAHAWKKHPFRQLRFWHNYVDVFSDLPLDVDGDGWVDIVSVNYFDQRIVWYRNPGKSLGPWQEAVVHRVEYAILADVDNDVRANELVPLEFGAPQAWWYETQGGTWVRHVINDRPLGTASASAISIRMGATTFSRRADGSKRRQTLDPRTGCCIPHGSQ